MQKQNILLLGSKSQARQMLLRDARIPFSLVEQHCDERCCDWNLPLPVIVERIALYKMDHVLLPAGCDGQHCFVLTADTLSATSDGTIHGKPIDRDDIIAKIRAARDGSTICTAFCLDRKVWSEGIWCTHRRIIRCVTAHYTFCVPEELLAWYCDNSYGYCASGAIAVEGFGAQFLHTVSGSYTTIVGLPMFELRQALSELCF